MTHRAIPFARLVSTVVGALLVGLVAAGAFAAQDGSSVYVRGALCTDATCDQYQEFLVPFTVDAVAVATGEVLGSCTVAVGMQDPICRLDFDTSIDHVFIADDTQVPNGYTYFGERIQDTGPTGQPVITFAFVPDDPLETENVLVNVGLCDDASCDTFSEFLPDFTVMIVLPDGGDFGSCVTDGQAQGQTCSVDVPADGNWNFQSYGFAVPAGYVYFGEPIYREGGPGPAVYTFAFYPEDAAGAVDTIPVRAALCTDATCEDYAEFLLGFEITAIEVQSDEPLDTCVTDGGSQHQGCVLELPGDPTFVLVWDDAQVPDGYVSAGGPITDAAGPGPRVLTLGFIPEDGAAPGGPGDGEGATGTEQPAPDGRPAAIIAGTCADLGDAVVDLTDVAAPEGEAAGAEDALAVETSFTALDLTLDDILADDHAVAVFAVEDPETVVACGGIGGVLAEDGSLALGLEEADDSGYAGVAYLTPDGDQTTVTVFISEDPAGDDATPAAD